MDHALFLRGGAQEAGQRLDEAFIRSFGVVRLSSRGATIGSDNGLIFQCPPFLAVCRFSGLEQQFITPQTPDQNGLVVQFS